MGLIRKKMATSATRFAVIDEKLTNIEKTLEEIKSNMKSYSIDAKHHTAEHDKISRRLAVQSLVNRALYFVTGSLFLAVLGIGVRILFGG